MKNIFFAQAQGTRKEQQDFFGEYISSDQNFLAHAGILSVVADGMGGLEKGADASKLAIHAFIKAYQAKPSNETIPQALKRSAHSANKAVYNFSNAEGLSGKTGSTLIALAQCKNEVFWLSVGDSRIYQLSNLKLKQLSKDHNYENDLMELVKKGELTEEDVKNNSQKAALTSYIGSESISKIDQNTQAIKPGLADVFMLASDGFYAGLKDSEIISIISSNPPSEASKKLIQCKLEKKLKNQDNLTISLIFQDNPTKKNKTKKIISIWLLLILLPFIGVSFLLGDLFFYKHFKSKLIGLDESSIEMNVNSNALSLESSRKSDGINRLSDIPESVPPVNIINTEANPESNINSTTDTDSKEELSKKNKQSSLPIKDIEVDQKTSADKSQTHESVAEQQIKQNKADIDKNDSQKAAQQAKQPIEQDDPDIKISIINKPVNQKPEQTKSLVLKSNSETGNILRTPKKDIVTDKEERCTVYMGPMLGEQKVCAEVKIKKSNNLPIIEPKERVEEKLACIKNGEEKGSENRYLPACKENSRVKLSL